MRCVICTPVLVAGLLAAAPATAQIEGVEGTELIVPIVANAGGAYGAVYDSLIAIDSSLPAPIDVTLRLYPRDAQPRVARIVVAEMPTLRRLSGVFAQLPETVGWLLVEASRPIRVESRTAGAVLHGLPPAIALAEGESTRLAGAVAAFSYSPTARYNFGVAEVGGKAARLEACVRGTYQQGSGPTASSGTFEGCTALSVPGWGSVQVNSLAGIGPLPPRGIVTSAETTITVTEGPGRVVAWATALDEKNLAAGFDMAPSLGLGPVLGPAGSALVVTKTGSGTGQVLLGPGEMLCDTACMGTAVRTPARPATTLAAVPAADSLFGGWIGCDAADGTNCSLLDEATRRVTAAFDLSQLTVQAFGFLDVKVSAGSRSFTCAGPSRRCALPMPPGVPIDVSAVAWPLVPPTDSISFAGPGCNDKGCSLPKAPDPSVVSVAMTQPDGRMIPYFGAYPPAIKRGESALLLVRTGNCNVSTALFPPSAKEEEPGVYSVQPETTTVYEFVCYYTAPGSTRRESQSKRTTVQVTGP